MTRVESMWVVGLHTRVLPLMRGRREAGSPGSAVQGSGSLERKSGRGVGSREGRVAELGGEERREGRVRLWQGETKREGKLIRGGGRGSRVAGLG